MRILVTGSAGFIGFHVARRLLANGHEVLGLDGMTPYYDVRLKEARHAILKAHEGFSEHVLSLEDEPAFSGLFDDRPPRAIIHLAAQAGVRYSLENPRAYIDSNLVGTFNVMELARRCEVEHLMVASTSSVYGASVIAPFSEIDRADHPLTLYAATKKAGEEMTHAYSHLWRIPTTVLRFFTVYGPWGRPDMALFRFARAIAGGEAIEVYNHGDMKRDFTYIDDLVEGIVRLMGKIPSDRSSAPVTRDSLSPVAPWRVVNLGRGEPVGLLDFIREIERSLGRRAELKMLPMQPGDAHLTFADVGLLEALTGYRPATSVAAGVAAFCDWFKTSHGLAPGAAP